jgi:D-threo-aldose 1-dehydrogenase
MSVITPSIAPPRGRTGLRLTPLGLGMRPLGLLPRREQEEARDIIRAAIRLGIGLLDTAPIYGNGESERRLGEVSAGLPASVVVSTKVGKIVVPETPRRPVRTILAETVTGGPSAIASMTLKAARMVTGAITAGPPAAAASLAALTDYSYDATMRSVEASLERTGLDRIGLVYIHDPDEHLDAAMTGAYRALERLRSDGTIDAVGASSNHADPLVHLAQAGDFDCFLLAGRYSLLDQRAHEELLPLALERGIAIVIGGVFNSGVLADPSTKPFYDYLPATDEQVRRARRLAAICDRHGASLKAAAIQFPYGHPAVTSVLLGVASVAELEEDVRLASAPVPAALWDEIRSEGLLARGTPVPSGS